MQILLLLVIGILRTWLMNHTANLTERFTRAVYSSGANRLRGLLVEAGVLIFAGSVMMSVKEYANATLANVFRKRLTDRVHETYFKGMNYYHMANLPGKTAIGDADQRIGSEITSVYSERNFRSVRLCAIPDLFCCPSQANLGFHIACHRSCLHQRFVISCSARGGVIAWGTGHAYGILRVDSHFAMSLSALLIPHMLSCSFYADVTLSLSQHPG